MTLSRWRRAAKRSLLKLKPVTFRYKEELDSERIPQFGLIAEQVEKVCPDLVVRDDDGQVTTVRYDAVNAMLLNEFLKEHGKVQDQQANIEDLKSIAARQEAVIASQQKQIDALTSNVQKVTARMELRENKSNVATND